MGGRVSSLLEQQRKTRTDLPVPKLGPPLHALPLHRSPCSTPARVSSSARNNGSWNLSFTRAALTPAWRAWASDAWVWLGLRKLRRSKRRHVRTSNARGFETRQDSPSKIEEAPDDVGDDFVLLLEWTKVGSDGRIRLARSNGVLLLRGRGEAEGEVNG